MLRKEWPLVLNTLLAQAAAGIFLFLAVNHLFIVNGVQRTAALQMNQAGLVLVGPIIALAMLLSLFHLGKPFRAYRVMTNLPSSWLSWEIFFSSGFFVLWLACFWLDQSGISNPYLIGLTALAGIFNVISMANIYTTTGRPGWAGIGTYIAFLGSMLIFGSAGAVLLLAQDAGMNPSALALASKQSWLVLFILVIELVLLYRSLSSLKASLQETSMDQLVSSSELDEEELRKYGTISICGWVLSLAGVGLLVYIFGAFPAPNILLLSAVLFILCGEFLGRSAFFSLGMGKQ